MDIQLEKKKGDWGPKHLGYKLALGVVCFFGMGKFWLTGVWAHFQNEIKGTKFVYSAEVGTGLETLMHYYHHLIGELVAPIATLYGCLWRVVAGVTEKIINWEGNNG